MRAPLPLSSAPWPEQVFAVTDALPGYSVGPVHQLISDRFLLSEVGIAIATSPYSPLPRLTSTMTTRSRVESGAEGSAGSVELAVDTTCVKRSTLNSLIGSIPIVGSRVNLDELAFPSGDALARVKAGSDRLTLRTDYLSDTMRISRYEGDGDNFYGYVREAADLDAKWLDWVQQAGEQAGEGQESGAGVGPDGGAAA